MRSDHTLSPSPASPVSPWTVADILIQERGIAYDPEAIEALAEKLSLGCCPAGRKDGFNQRVARVLKVQAQELLSL